MEILGASTFHNTKVKILNIAETETVELKNVNYPDEFWILASPYGPGQTLGMCMALGAVPKALNHGKGEPLN